MLNFIRAGGVGMILVLLLSVPCLLAAGAFVRAPDPRRLQMVRALSTALVFSVLTAVCSNLAAVMSKVPEHPEWSKSPDMPLIVMTGLAEALTPTLVGFAVLTVTWLLMAVGYRRSEPLGA